MDITRLVVIVVFLGILGALGSAMFSMVKGGNPKATARSLTWRIGLSISLFILLFVLYALGIIEPHGVTR